MERTGALIQGSDKTYIGTRGLQGRTYRFNVVVCDMKEWKDGVGTEVDGW